MWRQAVALVALLVPSSPTRTIVSRPAVADEPVLGRWDITIRMPDGERPSWLELSISATRPSFALATWSRNSRSVALLRISCSSLLGTPNRRPPLVRIQICS